MNFKKISFIFAIIFISLQILFSQEKIESPAAVNEGKGYKGIEWGTPLSQVKDKIKGKIRFTDDKKKIISSEENVEYLYGFFYKNNINNISNPGSEMPQGDEGNLYYVSIKFPLLGMNDVLKKITGTHGEPTGKNINENRGAIVWDKPETLIIMWIYSINGAPYCSRVIYLGKKISAEVNNYREEIFNKTELEILKTLNL